MLYESQANKNKVLLSIQKILNMTRAKVVYKNVSQLRFYNTLVKLDFKQRNIKKKQESDIL